MVKKASTSKKLKALEAQASTSTPSLAPSTPYHHGDLRRALIDAARAELAAVGRDALSLRAVARRAGVTHTAAYHHFADKAALLGEIAAEGFIALDDAMAKAVDAAAPDPLSRLRAAGEGYLVMAHHDPAAYDLMFNGCDFTSSPRLAEVGPRSFQRLCGVVAVARDAAGLVEGSDGDVLGDALLLWELVHGAAMLRFSGRLPAMALDRDAHIAATLQRVGALFAPRRG
jgi:AcrR family transcriptional regulator